MTYCPEELSIPIVQNIVHDRREEGECNPMRKVGGNNVSWYFHLLYKNKLEFLAYL